MRKDFPTYRKLATSYNSDIFHLKKLGPMLDLKDKLKKKHQQDNYFNRCYHSFYQDDSGEKKMYLLGLICYTSIFYHPFR